MKIEKLFITNFKGVENRTEINFRDLNVIVGQNDIGKSTISKALDFYFNKPNPSQDDCCYKSKNNIIEFELHLNPNETSIVIDQAIETTLESEGLVNNEGNLQLRRTFDVTNAKPKVETFITRKVYDQYDHILLTEAL